MTKFEVGKQYYMTSICDSNCHWAYEVTARTAKTVTLQQISQHPEVPITCRISVYEDCEQVMPEGRYSMAPVLRASREVVPSEPEPEEPQQPTASASSTNVIDFAAYREAKEAKREAEAELQYFIISYLPYVTPQEAEEIVTAQEEARQVEILRKICNRIDGERSRG